MPKNSLFEILVFLSLYVCLNFYSYDFGKNNSLFKTFIISAIAFGSLGAIMGTLIKW